MSVYVFTDGKWNPAHAIGPIRSIVSRVTSPGDYEASVEFIQFGEDPDARANLHLIKETWHGQLRKFRPVSTDVEPSDGNVFKMLLGAIDMRGRLDYETAQQEYAAWKKSKKNTSPETRR